MLTRDRECIFDNECPNSQSMLVGGGIVGEALEQDFFAVSILLLSNRISVANL